MNFMYRFLCDFKRPNVPWQSVTRTWYKFEQLRHRKNEVEYLWYEK